MCMQDKFYCMKQHSHWKERSQNHNKVQYHKVGTWTTGNYLAQKTVMDQTNCTTNCHQTFKTTLTPINAIQIPKISNQIKHYHKHQISSNSNIIVTIFITNNLRNSRIAHKAKLIKNIMRHIRRILFLFDVFFFFL